jgi:hypothetical protein
MNPSPEQHQIVSTVINEFLDTVGDTTLTERVLESVLKYVEGNINQATARCEVRDALAKMNRHADDERLNLCIETASRLAWGYLHWAQGQENADVLDFYPTLELKQVYQHAEAVDWIKRWQEKGGRVFEGRRMIALKNDSIWSQISAFKLPFPPFDLDSGMDLDSISRYEAEELGLFFPEKQIEPTTVDLNFGAALRQRLTEYFSPEVQTEKLEIAMRDASANVLVELARERLDSLQEDTPEALAKIIKILERCPERGFGEDVGQQASAIELLVDIFDSVRDSERANLYRAKHLESLGQWIEKGIPTEWNQLSNTYGLAAEICEKLNRGDQAIAYRHLQMEGRDGFTLLNDTLAKLKTYNGQIDQDGGVDILNSLTKAAEQIPQKYSDRHAEIFRATGEILEAWGDKAQAIEYYEFAIQKNPKVGIKRRLDNLRKNSSGAT